MSHPDACHWYAVHTKPKQETRAERNLQAWGVETFAPRLRDVRNGCKSSRPVCCITPLFPGYVFARFDAVRLLAKVRLTHGVHSVVAFGDTAAPVEDTIIALIQSRVQADGFVRIDEPVQGDLVEIVEGPLCSLVGVFDEASSRGDRVRLLLATIACTAHVEVPKTCIRRIPPRASA